MAKQKAPLYGLRKLKKRPQLNWLLDQDYVERLSDEEKQWLARFNNEFYLSATSSKDNVQSDEQLRDSWKTYKQRQRAECAISMGRSVQGHQNTEGPHEDNVEDSLLSRLDNRRAKEKARAAGLRGARKASKRS